MYAVDSHICRNKKGTLNLYAPTTDQPFIGGIMALLKRTPEQNAAFERCVGFLAEMIEKYSGKVEFPVPPPDSKNELGQFIQSIISNKFRRTIDK